ncbi:malto-oligosyltrehalose synthase [Pseudoxanthomonas composti]|uniref:Malto-oligosyltrehalose synthase n=1 Tax=Pseudoxanthomonas composti TaxID=2137479 RepID=A0A4Q1JWQ4_9GAMM|nr:malto-oligosyltrehalose synthase [Pseudoxanthomonas composti]RXR06605.1 malto-oligosyltrehalose synthase [Pseudoxanthomonas composti]
MTPIRSTYRLQLHADFTLHDAAAQVPYLVRLGISHLYLSPIGTAVPGSTHGYDQTDPTQVNPELGGEAALLALSERAQAHGMGLVLDIVPNHMATHAANRWWWDVLAQGRKSAYADWFDIDWRAPGHGGQLWLPFLDRPLQAAIAQGVLTLEQGEQGPQLDHHGTRYPLHAGTDAALLEAARGGDADALQQVALSQPYRLVWWRMGNDQVNYRRFFDITSLAGLRMERAEVFDAVHALPLRLLEQGHIDGVRVDHVDGLADPAGYVRRLRRALDKAGKTRGLKPGQAGLWLEKILAPGETLPEGWPCDGTSGYDFMDQVGGVLHQAEGEPTLRAQWQALSARSGDFAQEEWVARGQMLEGPLRAEFDRAVRAASELLQAQADTAELGVPLLAQAIAAVLRQFPVYRTYAHSQGLDARDLALWQQAAARAQAQADPRLAAGIEALLAVLVDPQDLPASQAAARRRLRLRLELLSAPLNAKSVEDTAFYRHGVLISRNEVGSHPLELALSPEDFHAASAARHRRALLATATHDHKRGEDVRARLAVLSAEAEWWTRQVQGFEAVLPDWAGQVDGGDRLMLWQMLVGAWPLEDKPDLQAYAERVAQWQQKALREAKLRSSWTVVDEEYEARAQALLMQVVEDARADGLQQRLHDAAAHIAAAGALNGLAQATLRLTVPGVPDTYQGCEGWDLSLVDPDNRRPVDYALRQRWQQADAAPAACLQDWRSGQVKATLLQRLLQCRRAHPDLFAHGDYTPLQARGAKARHVLGFTRRHDGQTLIVLAPRGLRGAEVGAMPMAAPGFWQDTQVTLPAGTWRDVVGDRPVDGAFSLARHWAEFPIAVLVGTA